MKTIIQIEEVNLTLLQDMWGKFLGFLPKILLGIAFILLCWVLLKIVNFILKKVLKKIKIDALTEKLNELEIFGKSDYTFSISKIILKVVRYFIILIFVVIASEMLGLKMVSEGISDFIAYLPILFSAILIFVAGIYIATLVRNAIIATFKSLEISGSKLVSNIVFFAIVIVVSITAINQAGINTEIITSNLTLILGSILISFTIAFGLGARDIVLRLLFSFYSKRNFKIGQHIRTKNIEGMIEQIDNLSVTIKTDNGLVVFPIKKFVDQKVEIIDKK